MALSNAQLLMLDNLIYTEYVEENRTVGQIITAMENDDFESMKNEKGKYPCEMSKDEWQELVNLIKEEPTLLDYRVTDYKDDASTGMRAACFVNDKNNPTDVNVVFRGTSGDYEWHDNGEGGYLSDTEQQELATDYINGLPEEYGNNITVTGHSKGGNKAQYVTIVTDRVVKCVSYDGQGFSEEFLEKYADEIEKKSQSIISISASDDFVNCLLYPIAGTQIYIETEEQDPCTGYHKPNILFDDNGNLRNQTEQSDLSKLINEYTTYMVSNLEEPERSATVDGIIDIVILVLGSSEMSSTEYIKQNILSMIYAGGNAVTHLDDFAFDFIGEKYGMPAELLTAYVAAIICPRLFADDLLNCGKEMLGTVVDKMMDFADKVKKKLEAFGKKAVEYAKKFVSAITTYADKAKEWFNKNFNSGYKYASVNTYIKVNTNTLRTYSNRLYKVNQRIVRLDQRLDALYTKVGLFDLWDLIQADALTGYSWRINRCINYLNDTAAEFESVEYSISSQI